ncbi:MAG: PRC and DUF2382 domain-containing protein [Nakamurella sp.]
MTNTINPDAYIGRNAVDPEGNKIGSVGQVYLNDETGQPDWITVNTGLFGMKENFAPLNGASFDGDDLVLPYGKDVVKDSPDVADASHLDADEQQSLYSYYQQYVGGNGANGGNINAGGNGNAVDYQNTADADLTDRGDVRSVGHDTSGPNTDDAMTRSEEQLRVGTEKVEAGRARLRKYVVTEQQTVQVPVSHEEVRLEREAITDANRGDALAGGAITEEEHEVVLHAERPVVTTEAVPVERVRLGTETITDQESVTGEVRKEQVELDDSTVTGTGTERRTDS